MCCLKFEQDHYESTRKRMPKIGKEVETPEGTGVVIDINVLKENLTVRIYKGDTSEYKTFALEEVKWQKPAPQTSPDSHNTDGKSEGKRARKAKQKPLLSSNPADDEMTDNDLSEALEEEMKPVEQSSDWLRAVEEALNAAKGLE